MTPAQTSVAALLARVLTELVERSIAVRVDASSLAVSGLLIEATDGAVDASLRAALDAATPRLCVLLSERALRARWGIPAAVPLDGHMTVLLAWLDLKRRAFTAGEIAAAWHYADTAKALGEPDWMARLVGVERVAARGLHAARRHSVRDMVTSAAA